MTQKELFIEKLRIRTKNLAVKVIELCNELKKGTASNVISYQIIKSSTSIAANYRAACRSRSKSEFRSKMSIVVEEADETNFWLELINEIDISEEISKLNFLMKESEEILKIMSKARNSSY
jgi:four helix bundle protein